MRAQWVRTWYTRLGAQARVTTWGAVHDAAGGRWVEGVGSTHIGDTTCTQAQP